VTGLGIFDEGEMDMSEKPSKTEERAARPRKTYVRPTLVKRDKLAKITAADTVVTGIPG
jgi:hypothetical protein